MRHAHPPRPRSRRPSPAIPLPPPLPRHPSPVRTLLHCSPARTGGAVSSDAVYYATLIPELGIGLSRLLHHAHIWYAHGVHFSVIDVLLLASA